MLAATLVLSACSGSDEPEPEPAATATPSSSPSEEVDEELTEPGAQLSYGDTATVDYETKGRGTRLELTVRSAQQGELKDFAGFDTRDKVVRRANFYYVRVKVKNAGEDRFGNAEVPLWGISGEDTLLPPVKFTSAFEKCPTETLPRRFDPGDSFTTCLVFLSPKRGSLEGVSYRPTEDFVPIEWQGKVDKPGKKQKRGKGGGDKG